MNTRFLLCASLTAAGFLMGPASPLPAAAASTNLLWYAQPAKSWNEALPIGNGRLGAMIFGGVPEERIQFNEDTLWTGQPHDYVRAGARDHLAEIRQLLFAGKIKEAEGVTRTNFLSDPVRQKAYQPFGDLHFNFTGLTNLTDYRRELDLDSAIVRVTYQSEGVTYRREAFASRPDDAIFLRFSADQPGHISFTLKLDSPHKDSETKAAGPYVLFLTGQVQTNGLRFASLARVAVTGGQTTSQDNRITVSNADSVTLCLVAATSFKNFQDITADPYWQCRQTLRKIGWQNFDDLLTNHLADYRDLFQRVQLDLGRTDRADLPTDERLARVETDGLPGDPALAALYFQYGRYLLIASSRPGGQPANLQGLWNQELNPPWESKWTLNINCEMNYWPAEVANLSECTGPLFDLIDDLVISGGRAAREQYGAGGWVVHHNTDLWRGAAPINNIDGVWPTGGAWLSYHLWEHYLFTGDKEFLARAYPVLKLASQFFVDYLVPDPKTNWLVTAPSFSPEQGELCYGPTMDNQLIRALMNSTIAAAGILSTDKTFAVELAAVRDKLPPNQIGKYGQLQEWLDDVDKPNNNHRHLSPLWALYPGADITPADTNLFAAARLLLQWRGDGSTGWSYAWRVPLWARVYDGDFAYRQLNGLLQKRTLPNLFDLCGPFQIDGNFGATAGIAEMLLQSQQTAPPRNRDPRSQTRILDLLPALPRAWPNGAVAGLCARGGFEVDLTWKDGALTRAVIRSKLGNPCVVRSGGHEVELKTAAGEAYAFDGRLQPVNDP
ncbi:MAG TPA: glycoside hydrolase family 95 protein [Candidatus Acidoferrum sp.]|nr:glycoside hydrolase family 95 protein [Candidatus Acidoferrum sp.]